METINILIKKIERDGVILWEASCTIFHPDRTATYLAFEDVDEEVVRSRMRQSLYYQKINNPVKYIQ